MAEVFGIITGGLSVVSVAVQLADSIKKLRAFCALVKEAPNEVRLALDEVEVLSYVLQDIAQSVQDRSPCSGGVEAAVTRSIRLCQVGSDGLKSLAEELHDLVASGKRWSSLKAAIKSEKLPQLRARLEGAKTTLMLANQCYYNAVQREVWEKQQKDMSELKITISSFTRTNEEATTSRSAVQISDTTIDFCKEKEFDRGSKLINGPDEVGSTSQSLLRQGQSQKTWSLSLFGFFEYRKSRRRGRNDANEAAAKYAEPYDEFNITFQLPTWLNGRRYRIRSRRAYTGWDFSLRTYNVVSSAAPVFEFCKNGDLTAVQQLFRDNLASPFDIDVLGRTLLHFAVLHGHRDTTRFLLGCGVDANARSFHGYLEPEHISEDLATPLMSHTFNRTPLEILAQCGGMLVFSKSGKVTPEQHLDLLRLLIDEGGADPTETNQRGENAITKYHGPTPSFSWLLRQEQPLIVRDTNSYTMLWSSRFSDCWDNSIDLIRETLPSGHVDKNIVQERDRIGATFLHYSVSRWCDSLSQPGQKEFLSNYSRQGFEALIREAIRAGADPSVLTFFGESPFGAMLLNLPYMALYPRNGRPRGVITGYRYSKTRRNFRKTILAWLNLLDELGIDLDAYLERELLALDMPYLKRWAGIRELEHVSKKKIKIKWEDPVDPWEYAGYDFPYDSKDPFVGLRIFWGTVGEWDHYSSHCDTNYCDCGEDSLAILEGDGSDDDSCEREKLLKIPGSWD